MAHCIVNGRTMAAADAAISIEDRGFRYGDGAFETLAVQSGVPYQFEWHMARLEAGLRAIKIPFEINELRDYCRELLKANALADGILRIQVTRGSGSRGYMPDPKATAGFVIETMEPPPRPPKSISLWRSSYSKPSTQSLPVRYKLCQGLNSTLARMEAAENQCFDALLFNDAGQICETSSANLFWFKEGALYTPSMDCGILEGATRAAILRLSPYPVNAVEATLKTLAQAEAVFVVNTTWKALAVKELLPVKYRWNSEAMAEKINALLDKDRADYCLAHRDAW